jgi:hypothetical protein
MKQMYVCMRVETHLRMYDICVAHLCSIFV